MSTYITCAIEACLPSDGWGRGGVGRYGHTWGRMYVGTEVGTLIFCVRVPVIFAIFFIVAYLNVCFQTTVVSLFLVFSAAVRGVRKEEAAPRAARVIKRVHPTGEKVYEVEWKRNITGYRHHHYNYTKLVCPKMKLITFILSSVLYNNVSITGKK